jgi:hypothetical protein
MDAVDAQPYAPAAREGFQAVRLAVDPQAAEREAEQAERAEAQRYREAEDAQRQRDLDAAFADAIEVVSRQRARLGRRVCSRHDGETTRRIFEFLRNMQDKSGGADGDPSFSS